MENIVEEINKLKKERNAIILAHNYQRPEVQDVADFVGDSLELAQLSARSEAAVAVICGVYFMAETAAIISPRKTILIPDRNADCPMARMIGAEQLRELKRRYPEAAAVCYVNSTAEVKAESDICCTSSNAERVVNSLRDYRQIIFVPDKNLGHSLSLSSEKEFIFGQGFCPTHERIAPEHVRELKKRYPAAKVLAHGECNSEVKRRADKILSTGQMCRYIHNSHHRDYIVATEAEILHRMRRENPGKNIVAASPLALCPNMKMNTLEKLRDALRDMDRVVRVEEGLAAKARVSIERMLAVG